MQVSGPLLSLLSRIAVLVYHVAVVTAQETLNLRGDGKLVGLAAVAGCHADFDKDNRPRQNCTAGGFSDIPSGLPPTTRVLLLPVNQLTSLTWPDYKVFTDIYELDLTKNQIHALSASTKGFSLPLGVLRLGSNGLAVLEEGCFWACPSLTELYLPGNALINLPNRVFDALSNLEILDLSSNRITVLPPNLIHPLVTLEFLYIEHNKIQVMPNDWLSKQPTPIPYLFLSANPWLCSCSLGYLTEYLNENEGTVYTRNGTILNPDAESVECGFPHWLQKRAVLLLMEEEYCPNEALGPSLHIAPYSPSTTPYPTALPSTTLAHPIMTSPPSTTAAPTTTTAPPPPSIAPPPPSMAPPPPPIAPPTTMAPHYVAPPPTTMAPPSMAHPPTTLAPPPPTMAPPPPSKGAVPMPPHINWRRRSGSALGARGVFCVWLLAGCAALCAAMLAFSAACALLWWRLLPTAVRKRRGGGGGRKFESLRLLNCRKGGRVGMGGGGSGEGVTLLYRSVLFVSREAESTEGEGRGQGGGGGVGEAETAGGHALIVLQPAGHGGDGMTDGMEGKGGGGGEGSVFREESFRLYSRQEEIAVQATVGVTPPAARYSVVLREEREAGAKDWVVGGWEVAGAGGAVRSSWGEWLSHYLPSMPWGMALPLDSPPAE